MGRTQAVKETILQRAKANPKFRAVLIAESLESIAENDMSTAKSLIHHDMLACTRPDFEPRIAENGS